MKRAALAIVTTITALVVVLSFKTHTHSASATPPAAITTPTTTTTTTTKPTASPSTTTATQTYTGNAADTRYGPVQVRITVRNGKLASVAAIDYPQTEPRDAQINSYAIPALNSEAAAAGNASIDMVSGATYTSEGYISSLQSALDKAGL